MSRPAIAESNAEATMTRLRPKRSERMLAGTMAKASTPVVALTARAATAGDASNSRARSGRTACAEYIDTKVAIPAAKSAVVMRV